MSIVEVVVDGMNTLTFCGKPLYNIQFNCSITPCIDGELLRTFHSTDLYYHYDVPVRDLNHGCWPLFVAIAFAKYDTPFQIKSYGPYGRFRD